MWAYSFTNNVIFEKIIVFHKLINIFAKKRYGNKSVRLTKN